jgi:hypothetical protein
MIVIFLQYEFLTPLLQNDTTVYSPEFLYLKKKFHEEPNIIICSQVSDTCTGREFFTPFVFFYKFLC